MVYEIKFDYENDLLVKISHFKYGSLKNYLTPNKSCHATCTANYKNLNECLIKLNNEEYYVKGIYTRAIKVGGKICNQVGGIFLDYCLLCLSLNIVMVAKIDDISLLDVIKTTQFLTELNIKMMLFCSQN